MSGQRDSARLVTAVNAYRSTLVAFSGGVDSSVVLAAAVRASGPARVTAMTATSAAVPAAELASARDFCAGLGVAHEVVATGELDVAGYRDNGPTRCYFCKSTLLSAALHLARSRGIAVVATGTNASDVAAGFRPGIRAGAERGVRTPLAELGLDKAAVRAIAAHWGLSTATKPAAACLASRIAYGIPVTPARLARVERAEIAVRHRLGGTDVRVRDLGDTVRLEVDADLVARALADSALHDAVRAAGFEGIPVTVAAFRSGSLNDGLPDLYR
jgi:pyridinium-3,5-biscarboxylic acid mononucleotide sulfurtransferase